MVFQKASLELQKNLRFNFKVNSGFQTSHVTSVRLCVTHKCVQHTFGMLCTASCAPAFPACVVGLTQGPTWQNTTPKMHIWSLKCSLSDMSHQMSAL